MKIEQFKTWLELYKKCWESGDSKGITELFSEDARYYETPFDEPMVGSAAIERYWLEGAGQAQKNVSFSYTQAAFIGLKGVSHWKASFVRVPSGIQVELDGYLEAEFNPKGQCSIFREWWHREEKHA
ncbi:nuclear transport factor 2 family protein [Endozoicomonas atrinae]|uniref:nuclear transport factor 2 family protein n=1 Tax=Endozoicomonas atrinae TaxID=1333660 RepID=UPI000826738A|nr:nuclear transport factor 2 family protein [Endozoicomonas atrinae]